MRALLRAPPTTGQSGPPTNTETPAATAARHVRLLQGGKPGDEALVLSELRGLDKDTLTKIDEEAARLPRNTGAALRHKISFVRNAAPDAAAGIDDVAITGARTTEAHKVAGGTVTVTTGSEFSWTQTLPRTGRQPPQKYRNAVSFEYEGESAQRTHWIQLIWRQVTVTDAQGRATMLDKETTNASGIKYGLTVGPSLPIVAVDRATSSEPWYEHNSPSHRDTGSIKVADAPSAHEDLFKEFLTGDNPAQNVDVKAHLTTYLVRDDKVLFQVATDVTWKWERNEHPGATGPPYQVTGPLYVVNAKSVEALDKGDREALVRDFPVVDYLP